MRNAWEDEGDQVHKLIRRLPLTFPSLGRWAPSSPRRGEEVQLDIKRLNILKNEYECQNYILDKSDLNAQTPDRLQSYQNYA